MTGGAPALEISCLACAAPLQVVDDRCGSCGSPAGAPQRRVVTILFADLVGYTALCSSLDPEDVHVLVRPLMNGLRRICEDLGGVVPGIEGDGFMAVFGALRAAEDDPLRAVTAAVQLQAVMSERRAAYGEALPGLRVGLNLGEVLVAPSWERSGFSLSGDPVNVASRLCGVAEPGQVVVALELVDVLPADIAWNGVEEVLLRNRAQPVRARRLASHALSSSQPARPLPSSVGPLVGRAAELAVLATAPAVLVTGEPGVGKSRLVASWVERSGRRALLASCPSFAAQGAAAVVADLVRPLRGACPELLGPTATRRVLRLLGEPVDSTETDSVEECLDAGVELLRAASASEPLVVVVEDLHWAAPEVLAVLGALAAAASQQLQVVLTAREDVDVPGVRIELSPLDEQEADDLVRQLLPGADQALMAALRLRAGGLPLYLEQCSRLLVEDGTVALTPEGARLVSLDGLRRVPTSMRLFVAARLDLLDAPERGVLEAVSVVGDTAHPELLRHLCRRDVGDEVEALIARGLLAWEASAAGPRLRWRHAVVRDVVYDGQLLSRRVDTHRNAAEWFGARLPREGLVGRALHLEAAVTLLQGRGAPDCSLVAETCRALAQLAHGALVEDPLSAAAAAERGVQLVEAHPQCDLDRFDLDVTLADASDQLGRNAVAVEAAQRALAAAGAAGDALGEARACLVLGRATWAADAERARALLSRAKEVFDAREDVVGAATVEVDLARLGQFDSIRGYVAAHEAAFRAAEWAGDFRWSNYMAQVVAVHAYAEGREELGRWSATARNGLRGGDTAGRGRLVLASALLELHADDLVRAVELSREAFELGEEAGVRHTRVNAAVVGLEAATCAGLLDEAERFLRDVDELLQERRTRMLELNRAVFVPLLLSRRGRHQEADEALVEASSLLGGEGAEQNFVRELSCTTARVLLDRGDVVGARAAAAKAVAANRLADEPFVGLRARLLHMAASVSARLPLVESTILRRDARERGAGGVEGQAARWLELDDLLRGDLPLVAVQLPAVPPGIEGTALDHEVRALLDQDWDRLLQAAQVWRGLGATVWPARPLLWHATITGDESRTDDARQVLAEAGAPEGLEDALRAQARSVVR